MSDWEPTEEYEVVEETRVVPATSAAAGGPGGPAGRANRALWGVLAALVVLVIILLVALLANDDDDDKVATDVTVTVAPVTTTRPAVAPATTKATAATTTVAPKTTIAPARCTGKTDPAKPALPAVTLYDAWRAGDRECAEKIATPDAVDTLFKLQPNGPEWDFQGCTEADEPDPHGDCAFTYEGGSTHFKLKYNDMTGWSIFEVSQVAD